MSTPALAETLASVNRPALSDDTDTVDARDFRSYLVASGAAEELIKVLVGLEEAHEKPEEPVRYLREMFKSQELSPIAAGRERVDVEQLLADHEDLRARTDEMSASLQAKLEQIAALESGRALPFLEKLLGWFPRASEGEGEEEAALLLDIAQLSAAVQRHSQPKPEGEEGAEAKEPAEAEAEPEAESPNGSAGIEVLTQWAMVCFGYEAELRARVPALSLEMLCESADPANAPEEKPLTDPELLRALQDSMLVLERLTAAAANGAQPDAEVPADNE